MTRASEKFPVPRGCAATRLGRRELVRGAGAALLGWAAFGALGCEGARGTGTGGRTAPPPGPRDAGSDAAARAWTSSGRRAQRLAARRGPVTVHSFFDLPADDARSHELSGIAWDDAARVLYAVQDEKAQIVSIVPDAELRSWTITSALPVDVGDTNDLEGLVVLPDGYIVCTEIGPHIWEIDRLGKVRGEIVLPGYFGTARKNKSLESLSLSPSGRYLFTTSEATLGCDGVLATNAGMRVRLTRIDLETKDIIEHVYLTDATARSDTDQGVSELLALSDDELLVLERTFTNGIGNSARLYRTKLVAGAACTNAEHVDETTTALPKTLFADLGLLSLHGVPPAKQPQPSPLLDNYEGLAAGPDLPDGRPTLLLVSDDNRRPTQVARILVLAIG